MRQNKASGEVIQGIFIWAELARCGWLKSEFNLKII
jgi:hypothetical protein